MNDMDEERFQRQLGFLMEVDQMKNIQRKTLIADGSRPETDAEHSWHLALMAMVLHEYAYSPEVDINRVIRMALVHDIVEVYAGDTFCYDESANKDKEEREAKAADRIFGMLPEDQGKEYRKLWEEFDAMETPDAIYAAAIDRFQPFINNYVTEGHTWKLGDVTSSKVYKRISTVKEGLPELWGFVEFLINDAIEKGYLKA